MISNRTLAIAAILALTVPALGAAAPLYSNPITEQLVEGHTVFAVLEIVNKTTVHREEFAAAVAVLVRENEAVREVQRFPGVLWFNDQYLVNPYQKDNKDAGIRYPCGGAVLAVNQGDIDPRTSLINVNGASGSDFLSHDQTPGSGALPNGDGRQVKANEGAYTQDYAWLGVNTGGTGDAVYTDIATGLPNDLNATFASAGVNAAFGYLESYLITDPNDHVWQIDVYEHYTRVGTSTGVTNVHAGKVWVVNVLGSPVFTPDVGLNCSPLRDVINSAAATAGVNPPRNPSPPWEDNPPAGYGEPSKNNYCYNGNANTATDPCASLVTRPTQPVRLYNAVLYFRLHHLTVDTGTIDHANSATHTNGCEVGTEWACPGGDDNAEGNSHPFHPDMDADPATVPATGEVETCNEVYNSGLEPTNHGGSEDQRNGEPTWRYGEPRYDGFSDCNNLHATFGIDLYFNGDARPFPPVVPNFQIVDIQGSSAPFHLEP